MAAERSGGRRPNAKLIAARQRLVSPACDGQPMSTREVAEAINAYLYHHRNKMVTSVDHRFVSSYEAGNHRWPAEHYREAFRAVLKVATDADLGFYPNRKRHPATSAPPVTAAVPAEQIADALTPMSPGEGEETKRRTLLRTALAGAGFGLSASALTLDDLRHIAAALDDARRYLDGTVVEHLRHRLAECASDDGAHGPKTTLPAVLGVVAAIEHTAGKVKPNVRRDLLAVGAQGAEFAGWLYRDMAMPAPADYWRDRATEWALEAGDHSMPGYVLLKKSQSAWDERDGLRMLTLAQAVQDGPWRLPTRILAEAAQQEARGHAMTTGDLGMIERKLGEAHRLLGEDLAARGEREPELAPHYDRSLFAIQTAICYREAGRASRAIEIYQEVLTPGAFSRRDYGYFLSLMAETLAVSAEADQAAGIGIEALRLARDTNSARTIQELLRLRDRLARWADRSAVRDFNHALAA